MYDDYIDENDETERPVDKTRKMEDTKIKKNDPGFSDFRFKHKKFVKTEEPVKIQKKSFLDNKREKEKNDENNFTSLVQEPRLLPGAKDVDVPYRNIDILFNNKNIYMNLQHFDPSRILYDLYDTTLWHPFVPKNTKIFTAFYPPPILSPPLLFPAAKRLHASIQREMKIQISALRSGKNLGTS